MPPPCTSKSASGGAGRSEPAMVGAGRVVVAARASFGAGDHRWIGAEVRMMSFFVRPAVACRAYLRAGVGVAGHG